MSDLLFRDVHVFDGQRYRESTSVLVRDGRIHAVDEPGVVEEMAHDDAEVVGCAGGLLMPGFFDSHMHPMVGGLERLRCQMFDCTSAAECYQAIAEAARARPDDTWFRGGGWSVDSFGPHGPTAAKLDELVPDRPAFLPSTDHHDAWVNTRALEVAGITRDTPDPVDGWIERDADGNPTGTLREGAMDLVWQHVETSQEEYAEALLEAQAHLHSWGITGWHDALIGGYAGLDDPTGAYLALLDRGELTARVRCSQWWDRARGTEQVDELLAERDRLAERGLDAGSVKVMMDGIAQTFTAAMIEPYVGLDDCPCGDHGLPFLTREQAFEAVTALDAAGLQVHFHAIGDAAVRDALDAVEAARRANGMNDLRHQVAHLQMVRPQDRHRFGDLEVVANLQGMWAHRDTPAVTMLEPHLDDERLGWHYPFADILAAHARFAGGSDWPVNPPEPMAAIHVLVNRSAWQAAGPDPEDALLPEQGISLGQALAAYTRGSAWVNHHEDAGHVEVGARGDLVLLDRDPFRGPQQEIGAVEVVGTWVLGDRVYDRADDHSRNPAHDA